MPPRHARDEQSRENWTLNEPSDRRGFSSRLRSQPDAGSRPGAGVAVVAPAAEGRTAAEADARTAAETDGPTAPAGDRLAAPGGDAVLDRPHLGDVDFSTYVQEARLREAGTSGRDGDGRASFERVGLGTLYRSGDVRTDEYVDDNVLGLSYSTVAPRMSVGDERWGRALRSFARGAIWLLPAGAVFLGLSSFFGWPTEESEPSVVSPGTWVALTAVGMGLWLVGVVALAALVATSRVRVWGIVAAVASALGIALLGPVVGVAGFARPAITRVARGVENDPNIAGAATRMQQGLLDHSAGRWLVVGGGVLLALGALAVVGTILGSRVLQRHDGWLMIIGIGLATAAAYLSWEFLFTLAAMVILAGALGLAYTASRIAPDGTPPPAY